MEVDKYDIVLYGASGFSGKIVLELLLKLNSTQYADIKYAIAGRSYSKLRKLIDDLQSNGNGKYDIPIIIADSKDEDSLKAMTSRTRVLMNCVGPYVDFGEPVVKACIETRTHYVDITAELYFMLKMYKDYHRAAEEANTLIITACGYGSVPASMGVVYLEKQFQGSLDSIECYSELHLPMRLWFPSCDNTLVSYGTWSSLIHEFDNFKAYSDMKKEVFPDEVIDPVDRSSKRSCLHRHKGKFWFVYPGPDKDVIDMSQKYLSDKKNKKPIKFNIYTTMPLLLHILIIIPAFFIYYYASTYMACFRKLLRRFPKIFTLGYMSHKGPSERNRSVTKYSFTLTGNGYSKNEQKSGPEHTVSLPDKKFTVKVSSADAYYGTAICVVFSAITILRDQHKMPKGGVLSPGAAFYDTDLIKRLNSNGIVYESVNTD